MNKITIKSIYKDAWEKLHGSKKAIWAIAIVNLLIILTIAYFANAIATQSQSLHYWLSYIIFPVALYLFIGPFYGSSMMVAIKHLRGEPVTIKTGYQYLHRYIPVAITMAIIGLVSNIISIITNIPSIAETLGPSLPYFDLLSGLFSLFVYVFFLLAIPLIMDKNYKVGQALRESLKKIKSYWLRACVIFLLAYLILFVTYIPAIAGLVLHSTIVTLFGGAFFIAILIWFLPFLFLLAGSIYLRLTGTLTK